MQPVRADRVKSTVFVAVGHVHPPNRGKVRFFASLDDKYR